MPTYEFACTECGNRVEVFLRADEAQPATCEVCGGDLRKVFHPAGIVLKGSGFYKTDSRSRSGSDAKGSTPAKEPAAKEKAVPAADKATDKKKKPAEKKEKSA